MDFIHTPLQQLYAYWQRKCRGRRFPLRADIDPLEMSFALGHILLVEVAEREPLRFRYRLWGSSIAMRTGRDMTGQYVEEWEPREFAERLQQDYTKVVQSGEPERRNFDEVIGDRLFDHERLLLPLGGADLPDQVTMIMAGIYHAERRISG